MKELTPEQIAMDKWLVEGTPLDIDEPVTTARSNNSQVESLNAETPQSDQLHSLTGRDPPTINMSASSIPTTRSWEEILPPYRDTAAPVATPWSVRFGGYFYPVLAPAPTWQFHSSNSNRCIKCNEDLRCGFGPQPFKSFHPDRLGCRCHCSALGVPEKAPKEDKTWLKTRSCGPPQASQTEAIPA